MWLQLGGSIFGDGKKQWFVHYWNRLSITWRIIPLWYRNMSHLYDVTILLTTISEFIASSISIQRLTIILRKIYSRDLSNGIENHLLQSWLIIVSNDQQQPANVWWDLRLAPALPYACQYKQSSSVKTLTMEVADVPSGSDMIHGRYSRRRIRLTLQLPT